MNRTLVASALFATLSTACSGEALGPVDRPDAGATGTWVTHRIDGQAMPAVVRSGIEGGVSWELRALADTLIVRGDGSWEQRVRVRQSQSDGFVSTGSLYDRGLWSRSGDALAFESTWIENVRFGGEVTASGELVVDHDFTLDEGGPAMRREMRR